MKGSMWVESILLTVKIPDEYKAKSEGTGIDANFRSREKLAADVYQNKFFILFPVVPECESDTEWVEIHG